MLGHIGVAKAGILVQRDYSLTVSRDGPIRDCSWSNQCLPAFVAGGGLHLWETKASADLSRDTHLEHVMADSSLNLVVTYLMEYPRYLPAAGNGLDGGT